MSNARAWLLATLFFPSGVFVAYGSARLLSWSRAVLLALFSYGCLIGFVQLMVHFERSEASDMIRSAAILGGVTMFCGWGCVLYRIGQRAGYWSRAVQRGWRRACWFAVAVLALGVASILVQIVVARLHSS